MFQMNKNIVFRKEFDDTGILFNIDTGESFQMNPFSAVIWQELPNANSIEELLDHLKGYTSLTPEGEAAIKDFVVTLRDKGLIMIRPVEEGVVPQ